MTPIRIRQYTFQVSRPYAAGTVLTAEEAQALNALRADNIRNNWARALTRRHPEDGQVYSRQELDQLQAELTRYDQGYTFGKPPAAKPGALDREARVVAQEQVEARLRGQGFVQVSPATLESLVAEALQDEAPWAEASRRLAEREAVIAGALEDLL